MTLEEAQLALTQVNDAISLLIAGKQINQLRIGSGAFVRHYAYGAITLDELKSYRAELLQIIDSYNLSDPTFRTNSSIPLTVRKSLR